MSKEEACPLARVKAIFEDGALHFEVASNIAVEQLCQLLTSLGKGHGDPLRVEITLPPVAAGHWRA